MGSDTGLLRGLTLGPIPYYVKAAGVHNKTVADFAGVYNNGVEYYRKNGVKCTFDELLTHTGGLSCQWGSDGQLYWCPHNHLPYSEDFSTFTETSVTGTPGYADPLGRTNATLITTTGAAGPYFESLGYSILSRPDMRKTLAFFVHQTSATIPYLIFQMNSYGGSTITQAADVNMTTMAVTESATDSNSDYYAGNSVDIGNGWYLVWATFKINKNASSSTINVQIRPSADGVYANRGYTPPSGQVARIFGLHMFSSHLGGMMNVPDARANFETYVKTEGSAVYLPRRNSYYYNSTTSSWDKAGITIESTAANNLMKSSMDFSDNVITTTSWGGNTSFANIQPVTHYFSNTHNAYEHEGDGVGSRSRSQAFTSNVATNTQYTFSVILEQVSAVNAAFGVYINGAWTEGVLCNYFWANNTVTDRNGGPSDFSGAIDLGTGPNGGNLVLAYATITTPNTVTSATYYIYPNGPAGVTTNTIMHFAQLEEGSVVSSPVITPNNSTITRTADTLTIANTNMAISTDAMSFHIQSIANFQDDESNVTPWRWYNSASNNLLLNLRTNSTQNGRIQLVHWTSVLDEVLGSNIAQYPASPATSFNIAARFTNTAMNVCGNGKLETENATLPKIAEISNFDFELDTNFKGTIALFQQTDADWTDAGLQELTGAVSTTFVANSTIVTTNTLSTTASATFRIWADLPSTVSNACLFEAGDSTDQGIFLGLRDSDTTPKLRLRAGDGGSIGTSTSVLDVTDFPQDDKNHEIIFDVNPATDTIRLWIDGVYKGSNTSSVSWTNDRWAGTGNGAVGRVEGTTCTGEPTTAWPTYYTDLEYYQE